MINWDKILKDFAYKCKGGAPDFTNSDHLNLLRESLIKFGWKENATNEFVGNLREAKKGGGPVPAGFTKSKTPKAKYYFINPQPKAGKSPIHDLTDETGKKRKWKYATQQQVDADSQSGGDGVVDEKSKTEEVEVPQEKKSVIVKDEYKYSIQFDDRHKGLIQEGKEDPDNPGYDENGKELKTGKHSKYYKESYDQDHVDAQRKEAEERDGRNYKSKHQVTLADLEAELHARGIVPPYPFPRRYLGALVEMMNSYSYGKGSPTDKLGFFLSGGGAGQINSQSGELLATIAKTLDDDQAEAFFKFFEDAIDENTKPPNAPTKEEIADVESVEDLEKLQLQYPQLSINTPSNQKKLAKALKAGKKLGGLHDKDGKFKQHNLCITKSWIKAARENREAFRKSMDDKYGAGKWEIESAAWDNHEEAEAMGFPNPKDNKSESTDSYARVRVKVSDDPKPDGTYKSYLEEVSLKKDFKIRFGNYTPTSILHNPKLTEEEIKEANKNLQSLTNDPTDDPETGPALEDGEPPDGIDVNDMNEKAWKKRQENDWLDYQKTLTTDDIAAACAGGTLTKAQIEKTIQVIRNKKKVPGVKIRYNKNGCPDKKSRERLLNYLKDKGNGKPGGGPRARNHLLMEIADHHIMQAYEHEIDSEGYVRVKRPLKLKPGVSEAQKAAADKAIETKDKIMRDQKRTERNIIRAAGQSPFKERMIGTLREKLPLKAVVDGEEIMVLGKHRLNRKIMSKIFGIPEDELDFDKIIESFEVDLGPPPTIVYNNKVSGQKICIGLINVRADGQWYGNSMKFESDVCPEFEELIRQNQ